MLKFLELFVLACYSLVALALFNLYLGGFDSFSNSPSRYIAKTSWVPSCGEMRNFCVISPKARDSLLFSKAKIRSRLLVVFSFIRLKCL